MTGTDLEYHGVVIRDVRTTNYSRVPIVEDNVYLFSELTLEVEGVILNPAGLSYVVAPPLPQAAPGQLPSTTDQALRFWMLQPRGRLKYSINGVVALESPAATADEDANRGPFSEQFNILAVHSDLSMEARFRIRTYVNEAGLFVNQAATGTSGPRPPFLLKNTWKMTHDIDRNYYLIRIVDGEAVFNPALMPSNTSPDDYRQWLLPPAVPGMKRETVEVVAQEDGVRLQYRVIDREARYNLLDTGITDIQCRAGAGYAGQAFWDSAIDFSVWGVGVWQMAAGIAGAGASGAGPGTIGSSGYSGSQLAGAAGNAAPGFVGNTVSMVRNIRPNRHIHVYVRVTGAKLTPMTQISNVAYIVLGSRLPVGVTGNAVRGGNSYSRQFEEVRDYGNGIVEVHATYVSSVTSGFVQFSDRNIAGSVRDLFVDGDRLTTENFTDNGQTVARRLGLVVYAPGGVAPQVTGGGPVAGSMCPPGGAGTRGTDLAAAVAQALQDATTPPAAPPWPRASLTTNTPNIGVILPAF